jgi:hypothetical protein
VTKYLYRSADTGEFVTKAYAAENPATTVKESIDKDYNQSDREVTLMAQLQVAVEALLDMLGTDRNDEVEKALSVIKELGEPDDE